MENLEDLEKDNNVAEATEEIITDYEEEKVEDLEEGKTTSDILPDGSVSQERLKEDVTKTNPDANTLDRG